MFDKLKNKWNVSGIRFVLILCTFAVGGSMCGYLGRHVMNFLALEKSVLWWILYVIVVTILWPFCVLVVSIFTGQFTFFRAYLARMASRMKMKK